MGFWLIETAQQILSKLLTVDGHGSGLDADTVDGQHASDFATTAHTHTLSEITDAGTAASKNTGTSSGQVPLLGSGGKLPSSVLPDLAISEFLGSVNSQAAMLALSGQRGDWCNRSDESKTYILVTDDPSQSSSWVSILAPSAAVQSVNGYTGVVVLDADDLSEGVTNLFLTSSERSLLSGSTSNNTNNALVRRGSSGEISIGALTATSGTFSGRVKSGTLSDATVSGGGTVTSNVANGDKQFVSASGNFTLAVSGSVDKLDPFTWQVKNTSGGTITITVSSSFRLPSGVSSLTVGAGKTLWVTARYNLNESKWDIVGWEEFG